MRYMYDTRDPKHITHIRDMHPMAIHIPRSAITISDDGSLGQKTTFSSPFTRHMLIMNDKGRCDVLGTLVDDAEVTVDATQRRRMMMTIHINSDLNIAVYCRSSWRRSFHAGDLPFE